jgi:hypothetical protein
MEVVVVEDWIFFVCVTKESTKCRWMMMMMIFEVSQSVTHVHVYKYLVSILSTVCSFGYIFCSVLMVVWSKSN